ncbi:MAG: heme exporter protein CcmB [Candidatus Marinimicrobia bacterium]|nr:heme exporter protein CcmB [Candidatus Neomarinimicrobiota bacterium]MCH8303933.1 heme exporter protein CcmB [Candidatus Neomarinimicrobiota bacterium]TFB08142.1 hypothetical protein E3V36_07995 [Candidatus Marinimicrobia bacterium MT.SAG.2]
MRHLSQLSALLRKDILIELKSRETVISMLLFSLLVIIVFNFAFEADRAVLKKISPGLLWITFLFFGVLGLNRSFTLEKENDSLQGTLLAPIDRSVIYLGKFLSNLLFILFVELITLPLFTLFLNVDLLSNIVELLPILLLGSIGFISVGTLFSAMAVNTKMREIMLPLLLYPITTPAFIAATKCTSAILRDQPLESYSNWLSILILFDLVFLVTSFLIFEFVVEE